MMKNIHMLPPSDNFAAAAVDAAWRFDIHISAALLVTSCVCANKHTYTHTLVWHSQPKIHILFANTARRTPRSNMLRSITRNKLSTDRVLLIREPVYAYACLWINKERHIFKSMRA